jgi:hypothetical protein
VGSGCIITPTPRSESHRFPNSAIATAIPTNITTPAGYVENYDKAEKYVEHCIDILDTLAGNLLTLETLCICAVIDVPRLAPLGNLKRLKALEWKVDTADALRGVPIGADLTLCIPRWFYEFVEDAHVYIVASGLERKGKILVFICNESRRFHRDHLTFSDLERV